MFIDAVATARDVERLFKSLNKGAGTVNGSWLERTFDPSAVSMRYNSAEAEKARAWEAEQAQTARDFEERLSNTSYQRGVADMKAAGLNPALALSGAGYGASTPSASAPVGATARDSGGATSAVFMKTVGALVSLASTALTASAGTARTAMNIASNARIASEKLNHQYTTNRTFYDHYGRYRGGFTETKN